MNDLGRAVVLLSGGQDSTTCLAWALDRYGRDDVLTCSIDYGQRHRVELARAIVIADELDAAAPHIIEMPFLSRLGAAALTNPGIDVDADATGTGNRYAEQHGLPSTFVPGRNALFITAALAYGAMHDAYTVVTGVCEADAAGYPDCRASFIHSMRQALGDALDEDRVQIDAPLLSLNKAQTFALADSLGVLNLILTSTHTCYEGDRDNVHAWGYGCGECPACVERARGWDEFMEWRRTEASA